LTGRGRQTPDRTALREVDLAFGIERDVGDHLSLARASDGELHARITTKAAVGIDADRPDLLAVRDRVEQAALIERHAPHLSFDLREAPSAGILDVE